MRSCEHFQDLLTAYIDGYLQLEEERELEKHLQNCPQCQRELAELQETVNLISGLKDEELIPPASFRRELRDKLEKSQVANLKDTGKKKIVNFNKLLAWMPLAAAAILLLIMTPFALNFTGMKSSAPTEMALDYGAYQKDSMKMAMPEDGRAGITNSVQYDLSDQKQSLEIMEEQGGIPPTEDIEQKIIKTGYLQLEVESYKEVSSSARTMAQTWGGYTISENTYTFGPNQNLLAGNISLRIPQHVFEQALADLEELGNVRNRSASGQDVTEEYVDIQSRLKAMRLKEERLLELLAKSGSLGDVLAVENELARTRADLEALEGRLRYLSNRTDYSTINMELRETLTPAKQITTTGFKGVLERTQQAFIRSINSIIIGMGNLVVFIGGNLPYLLIGLGALATIWIIYKNYRNKE